MGPGSEVLEMPEGGAPGQEGAGTFLQLGGGCGRGPRDLVADIPWRPRGPNWQGQLRTGAGPALFPGWRPLSIQALRLLGAGWAAGTWGRGLSRESLEAWGHWGSLGGWGRTRRSSRSRRGSSCTNLTTRRRRCRCG